MQRLNSSRLHRNLEDKLIDIRIAFDALFGEEGEVTHKVSVRAAQLLGGSIDERRTIRDTVKKAYSYGSRVIHGSSIKPSKAEEYRETLEAAEEILRRCLEDIIIRGQFVSFDLLDLGGLDASTPTE